MRLTVACSCDLSCFSKSVIRRIKAACFCLDPRELPTHANQAAPQPARQPAESHGDGSPGACGDTPAEPGEIAAPASRPAPAGVTLRAPLRLMPVVRAVLEDIIATLSGQRAAWAAWPCDEGLFVPLKSYAARRLPQPQAVRALADAGMLTAGAPLQRRPGVAVETGLLIAPAHVPGLAAYGLSALLQWLPMQCSAMAALLMVGCVLRIVQSKTFTRHDPERFALHATLLVLLLCASLLTLVLPVPLPSGLAALRLAVAVFTCRMVGNYHRSG